jgi:hypothetical protein
VDRAEDTAALEIHFFRGFTQDDPLGRHDADPLVYLRGHREISSERWSEKTR